MVNKKRQGKKNSGAGNPAKAAPRGRSVYAIQAEQSVAELREPFARWVSAQVPTFSPEQVAQVTEMQLDVIRSVGAAYAQAVSNARLRDLDAEVFGQVLADFLVQLPAEVEPEPIFTTWLDYVTFLNDEGLWEGSEQRLAELIELLEDALNGFAQDDAQLCELLRETPLYTRVKSFAQALGEGIDVTDLEQAANAPRARVLAAMGLDATAVNPQDPAPLVFNYVWNAALMSVVEVDGLRIVRDEEAFANLVDGDEADSAQILFEMAVGCVQGHLNPTMETTLRDEAHYLVLRHLLVTASTGHPGDLAGLRRNCGPQLFDQVLPEARAAMDSLVDFGLLSAAEGGYRIDERLMPAISAGISEVEAFFEDAD